MTGLRAVSRRVAKHLGSYIAFLRQERKLTQHQLSELIDVDPVTISRWENGARSPGQTHISLLAKFLDEEEDWMLGVAASQVSDEATSQDWRERQGLIGRRLREAREKTGLSEQEVQEQTGFRVKWWEEGLGTPTLYQLHELGQTYGVSVDWLIGRTRAIDVSDPASQYAQGPVFAAAELSFRHALADLDTNEVQEIQDFIDFVQQRQRQRRSERSYS